MKNIRITTKLQVLTLIMIISTALIGGGGYLSLTQLQGAVDQLAGTTVKKLLATESAQKQTLIAIRGQKNAVLATTDKDSKDFADKSRAALKLAADEFKELDSLMAKGSEDEKNLLQKAKATFDGFVSVNAECLTLAEANTNLKANALLWGPIKQDVATLLKLTDKLVESPGKEAADTDKRRKAAYELARDLLQLERMLKQHIDKVGTASDIQALDRALAEAKLKVEHHVDETLALCGPDEVALRAPTQVAFNDLNQRQMELLEFSRLDSNNKSFDLSLVDARIKMDDFTAATKALTEKFNAQTKLGRDIANDVATTGIRTILITASIGLALQMILAWLIANSVTKPVGLVRDMAQSMASGILTNRIKLDQTDEVGQLATATDSLADSLTSMVVEMQNTGTGLDASAADLGRISRQLLTVSDQASTQSASVASAAEQLSTSINSMSSAAEEMSVSFASISSATEEMSVNVGSISSAAEQTSSNVAVVATAVEEISGSFTDVLTDVREGARVASQASQLANSATKTMKELNQAGGEISKVTETIKMIALQTNLLALNATIEATSAGEAGKGFAVVAHEIKELANQSAKAAEDIARKIEGVQTGTRDAVGVIQEVADVIKAINASADRISHSVENQTRAAQTISQNVAEANKGVGQIARSIAEVATSANDMSRNVSEAARGATDVSRSVQESAKAARGISSSIATVSEAARATSSSAGGVTTTSESLSKIAEQLKKLVARFKIPGNAS